MNLRLLTSGFWLLASVSALHAATVTGTITSRQGGVGTVPVVFRALDRPLLNGSISLSGGNVTTNTSSDGTFSVSIVGGRYNFSWGTVAADNFNINVPTNSSSYNVTDLRTNTVATLGPTVFEYSILTNVTTNGVTLGTGLRTVDFVSGVTGYVSGTSARLGVSSAAGGGASTNANQFGAAGAVLTLKAGAAQTNANFTGTGTNNGDLHLGGNALRSVVNVVASGDTLTLSTIGNDVTISGPEGAMFTTGDQLALGTPDSRWGSTYIEGLIDTHVGAYDTAAQFVGNVNSFFQILIHNTNSGSGASSDFVAQANGGTSTTNYVDWGINGSNGAAAPYLTAWTGYGYAMSTNLRLGALGVNGLLQFDTDGGTTPVNRAQINAGGLNVNSNVSAWRFTATNITASRAVIADASGVLTNEPSTRLFNLAGTGATTNLATNANQFGAQTTLTIKESAALTNLVVWPSNNTGLALLVTNTPGTTRNLVEMLTTNRTGLTITSNGVPIFRANGFSGTNASVVFDEAVNTQTYIEFRNQGVAAMIMRGDSAGNAVLSSAGSGAFYIGADGGSGVINFNKFGVGTRWSIDGSGHFAPGADNSYDLGRPSLRVRNAAFSGLVTNDGTIKVQAGDSTAYGYVGGTLCASNVPIVSAGSSETNLLTYSVGGNALTNLGDRLLIRTSGRFALTGQSKRLRLVYGSTTVLDSGSQAVSNCAWGITAEIIRSGNSAQSCNATLTWGPSNWSVTNHAVDLAEVNGVANTLALKSTATNNGDVTNRTLTVDYCPAP